MEYRTIQDGELDRWAEHCASVFQGETDTPDYFRNHFLLDPSSDPRGVFIADDHGEIASTLRVFRREIYLGGAKVAMGGIGEVSTKPQYRKLGLSGALLKMAIAYMEREGLCVSMLFTGVNGHYARYGWFTAPQRSVPLAVAEADALPDGASMRPMRDADVEAVRALYAAHAAGFDGCVVRDDERYWTKWMPSSWSAPQVVERDGHIWAYIDAGWSAEKSTLWLKDFAERKGGPGAAAAMKAFAAARGLTAERLRVPAALLPGTNGPFEEGLGMMLRLNVPFDVRGERIDTAAKLASAAADLLFYPEDAF